MKNHGLILILLLILTFSCTQKGELTADLNEPALTETAEQKDLHSQQVSQYPANLHSYAKTKIIKKVHYRFEVKDVQKSMETIEHAIKKYPAYIASSKLQSNYDFLENTISIRVQNEYFDDLLKEIDQQAIHINFRNVQTEDVSKDFVDLESRLKTKRDVEQRYIAILRNRTGTIEEVLQAEQQIATLHEEIEATVSRLNYLKDQVSYSTINLEFYQPVVLVAQHKQEITTLHKFKEAFNTGWMGFIEILLAAAYVWPILLLILIIGIVLRYRRGATLTTAKS